MNSIYTITKFHYILSHHQGKKDIRKILNR